MGHNLLLADDSITIQKVVKIIFSGDSYDLTIVGNGTDALLRARESVPEVMLIDAVMPGMNGYEVCREAKKDPLLSAVPILLLTGVFEPFDEGKARESGADDFIAKPFESQVLIDKVMQLISLGDARRAATYPVFGELPPVPEFLPPEPDELPFVPEEESLPQRETVLESPPLPAASPLKEDLLVIEEVSLLDDLWGMGEIEAEQEEPSFPTFAPGVEAEAPVPDDMPVEEFSFEDDIDEIPALTPEFEGAFEPEQFLDSAGQFIDSYPDEGEEQETLPGVAPVPEETAPIVPAQLPPPAAVSPLSEEQLVAALSTVSRELIQRIVWEVVPDLAESLIREEIRKIREGV
jgi:CheY-like chemotaxis protein